MQDKILIGRIVKAQGIKGEVKVMPITSNINRFKSLNYAFINGKLYSITHARIGIDNFVYLTFAEVTDRNTSETLRNAELYIDKQDSIELSENEFFIDDLIHSFVQDENGNEIGEIINVENYGSADIITVNQGMGMSFSFPLLNEVIVSFNEERKLLVINSKKLAEIRV